MKKVRIMLSAVTVLAIVGGALAFKARNQHNFYSLNAAGTSCNVLTQKFWTEEKQIGALTPNYTIAPSPAPCSVKTIVAP